MLLTRSMSAGRRNVDARPVKLACRNVWKLFGSNASSFIRRAQGQGVRPGDRRGRAGRRGTGRRPGNPPGRDLHHHGPVRLRQVDAGALHVASGRADLRHRRVRGQGPAQDLGCRAHRAAPPPHGHGVPELRAAAASQRHRKHRLSAVDPGHGPRRPRRAGTRGDRAGRPARARALLSRANFPAASSSASASPAASRPSRRSGSSTSRSRRSIRSSAARCRTS